MWKIELDRRRYGIQRASPRASPASVLLIMQEQGCGVSRPERKHRACTPSLHRKSKQLFESESRDVPHSPAAQPFAFSILVCSVAHYIGTQRATQSLHGCCYSRGPVAYRGPSRIGEVRCEPFPRAAFSGQTFGVRTVDSQAKHAPLFHTPLPAFRASKRGRQSLDPPAKRHISNVVPLCEDTTDEQNSSSHTVRWTSLHTRALQAQTCEMRK